MIKLTDMLTKNVAVTGVWSQVLAANVPATNGDRAVLLISNPVNAVVYAFLDEAPAGSFVGHDMAVADSLNLIGVTMNKGLWAKTVDGNPGTLVVTEGFRPLYNTF